jgi:hypothetical protein
MSAHQKTSHDADPTFGTDTRAAYMGLVFGLIVLGAIVFSIVKMTNAKYSHETTAEATK